MRGAKLLTGSAVLSALWGSMDCSMFSPQLPRQTYSRPPTSRGKSGVADAKRAAKKRRNIKARSKK